MKNKFFLLLQISDKIFSTQDYNQDDKKFVHFIFSTQDGAAGVAVFVTGPSVWAAQQEYKSISIKLTCLFEHCNINTNIKSRQYMSHLLYVD